MTVDESKWIKCCPQCGRTDNASQVPVTRGAPCEHCGKIPFKSPDGLGVILYYTCLVCGIRYLQPKLEKEEVEYNLFQQKGY